MKLINREAASEKESQECSTFAQSFYMIYI